MFDSSIKHLDLKESSLLPRLWDRLDAVAISVLFLIPYFGFSLLSIFLIFLPPFVLTAVTVLTSLLFGTGSIWLTNFLRKKHSWRQLGFAPIPKQWWLLGAILAVFSGVLRGLLLNWLSVQFPALNVGTEFLEEMLVFDATWEIVGVTLLASTLVPFWEEFFFRGFVHNVLRNRLNMWAAIIVSSLIFGFFHFIPLQVIGAFTLGLVMAYAYEKSGSLWVAIYIHALNNVVFTLLAQFMG